MESGSIVDKNDVNSIKCIECNKPLDMFEKYDYYDLHRYFIKQCCGFNYTLMQKSYVFNIDPIKLEIEEEIQ